jgi:hypothetical protein
MGNHKKIPVLVTTEHRGVFFGYMDPARVNDSELELDQARLCVYWSSDMKGFMGLAANGPSASCRIGPPVDLPSLRKITAVLECTPEAAEKWEKAPWQ